MTKFCVGDIVECIDVSDNKWLSDDLILGKKYKIFKVEEHSDTNDSFIMLEGLSGWFFYKRFSKVIDKPIKAKQTRSKWEQDLFGLTPKETVDFLIKEGILEIREETPEEVFIETAIKNGYNPKGEGGFIDNVFDLLKVCNLEFKFKN